MKHEIITLADVKIIGMYKEIAFCKGQEECPKFWDEYVERIVKPVFMEHKTPDAFQQAAIDNSVGEFGLCTCDIPNHNCMTCAEENFGACSSKTFTYVIGGPHSQRQVAEGSFRGRHESLSAAVSEVLQGVAAPAPGIPLLQQRYDDGMVQRHRHRLA